MAEDFRSAMRGATTEASPTTAATRRAEAVSQAVAQERAGVGAADSRWRGGGDYYFETSNEGIKITGGDAAKGNLQGGKSVVIRWDDPDPAKQQMLKAILAEQGEQHTELGVTYQPAAPPESPAIADAGGVGEDEGMGATGEEAPYWQAAEWPSEDFTYTGDVPELQQMFAEGAPFHPYDAEGWDTSGWSGPTTNRELEAAARARRINILGADESGRIHYNYEGRGEPRVSGAEAEHMALRQQERRERPQGGSASVSAARTKTPPTRRAPKSLRPNDEEPYR